MMIVAALALALAAAPVASQLSPFQFLVGHCWRTTLEEGPTDTHCFATLENGARIRDRHAVRKDGKVIYTGESVFSVVSGAIHYRYDGSTGFHLEGPMHWAGGRIVFDDVDDTGSETSWRQIDGMHWEEVTTASAKVGNAAERKLYELVTDETP